MSSTVPTLRMSEDRQKLIVQFPGAAPMELDTADVERMVQTFSNARINMEPAIPQRDPTAGDSMVVVPKGRWWVQPDLITGGIVLALLHPGFGWVGMQMDQSQSSQLIQRILQQRPSDVHSTLETAN
jgi:hypothetical protein